MTPRVWDSEARCFSIESACPQSTGANWLWRFRMSRFTIHSMLLAVSVLQATGVPQFLHFQFDHTPADCQRCVSSHCCGCIHSEMTTAGSSDAACSVAATSRDPSTGNHQDPADCPVCQMLASLISPVPSHTPFGLALDEDTCCLNMEQQSPVASTVIVPGARAPPLPAA